MHWNTKQYQYNRYLYQKNEKLSILSKCDKYIY